MSRVAAHVELVSFASTLPRLPIRLFPSSRATSTVAASLASAMFATFNPAVVTPWTPITVA